MRPRRYIVGDELVVTTYDLKLEELTVGNSHMSSSWL